MAASGVPYNRWFKDLIGCEEPEWRTRPFSEKGIELHDDGTITLHNTSTSQRFSAGRFALEPVVWDGKTSSNTSESAVTAAADSKESDERAEPGEFALFNIICRGDTRSREQVNVAYHQALPENKGAVFQVASNFNGVEAISEASSPDTPNFTSKYFMDNTQGPAASISAGAAAVARVHCAFASPDVPPSEWDQTAARQLNFLGHPDLQKHFPMTNGYITLRGNEPPFPNPDGSPEEKAEYERLLGLAVIGYHEGCQVTTGEFVSDREYIVKRVADPEQCVDQVFAAAVNLGSWQNESCLDIELRGRFCLDVAYQGAYAAAQRHGRRHLVLTLVGGGVFGNPLDWVMDAMVRAHVKYGRTGAGALRKVSVVKYGVEGVDRELTARLSDAGIPYQVTQYNKHIPRVIAMG